MKYYFVCIKQIKCFENLLVIAHILKISTHKWKSYKNFSFIRNCFFLKIQCSSWKSWLLFYTVINDFWPNILRYIYLAWASNSIRKNAMLFHACCKAQVIVLLKDSINFALFFKIECEEGKTNKNYLKNLF